MAGDHHSVAFAMRHTAWLGKLHIHHAGGHSIIAFREISHQWVGKSMSFRQKPALKQYPDTGELLAHFSSMFPCASLSAQLSPKGGGQMV